MLHLRVHAGPHDRRHCPVSADVDVNAREAFTLYQEPGKRPRHAQLEALAKGSRLTWIVGRLDAGQTRDFRLVRSPKRRRPSPRVRWRDLGEQQVQALLDGKPLADWQLAGRDFPGLTSLHAPGGEGHLLEGLWIEANLTPQRHQRSEFVETKEQAPGAVFGRLTFRCRWLGPSAARLAEERAQFTVFATPAHLRLVDVETSLHATTGPVKFAAGLGIGLLRLKLGERLRAVASETIVSAAGAIGGMEVARLPAGWCAVPGPVGLTICGHADNPGAGAVWRLGAHGILDADPFTALERFGPVLDEPSPHIAVGESLVFRYRLAAVAGNPRPAVLRQHCLNFLFPPRVELL
jgi:hypothetical protein